MLWIFKYWYNGIRHTQSMIRCDKKVNILRDEGHMYNYIKVRTQEMRFVELLVPPDA